MSAYDNGYIAGCDDTKSELQPEIERLKQELSDAEYERDNLRNAVEDARNVAKQLEYDLGNA